MFKKPLAVLIAALVVEIPGLIKSAANWLKKRLTRYCVCSDPLPEVHTGSGQYYCRKCLKWIDVRDVKND